MLATEEGPVPRGNGERILVVDDEELLAQLGGQALTALGYEVEVTTLPATALALVRSDPRGFALVLTDQTMPGMTGLVLAMEVRLLRPDLPVILMTAYTRAHRLGGRSSTHDQAHEHTRAGHRGACGPFLATRSKPKLAMAKILLIDDDDSVRTMLRLTLAHFGHTVNAARNGREGLELFDQIEVDLVITDIVMPEKEGLEVLMELRKRKTAVKTIAISGGGR